MRKALNAQSSLMNVKNDWWFQGGERCHYTGFYEAFLVVLKKEKLLLARVLVISPEQLSKCKGELTLFRRVNNLKDLLIL